MRLVIIFLIGRITSGCGGVTHQHPLVSLNRFGDATPCDAWARSFVLVYLSVAFDPMERSCSLLARCSSFCPSLWLRLVVLIPKPRRRPLMRVTQVEPPSANLARSKIAILRLALTEARRSVPVPRTALLMAAVSVHKPRRTVLRQITSST